MIKIRESLGKVIIFIRELFQIKHCLFISILIETILKSLLPFLNFFFSMIIINELTGECREAYLFQYAIYAVVSNGLISFISCFLSNNVKIETDELKILFDKKYTTHIMNLPFDKIESNEVKELQRVLEQACRVNGGIYNIINSISILLISFVSIVISFISFIKIFADYSNTKNDSLWTGPVPIILLLIVSITLITISFFIKIKENDKIVQLNMEFNRGNGGAFGFMEIISENSFGKDARIYGMHSFLGRYFEKLWSSSIGYKVLIQMGRQKAKLPCITVVVDAVIEFLIYAIVGAKASSGEIEAGAVVLYVGSIHIFIKSIADFVYALGVLVEKTEILNPYISILNYEEEILVGDKLDQNEEKTIQFENVSFKYPGTDVFVLKNINLIIHPGEKIAIVGQNGSGKTTLIKLLCGLYRPTEGRILLNGRDIQQYDVNEYRQMLGVVFQDFQLFSFTLEKAIAANKIVNKERIMKVLNQTGIDSWCLSLQNQLCTYIHHDFEENGVEPSGGELQKLAIARAIYNESEYLILDEPTAALDPRSEMEIYKLINNKIENKTIIYISHRLASCSFSKRILVLSEGSLVQDGVHSDLLIQDGVYKELWSAQAEMFQNM